MGVGAGVGVALGVGVKDAISVREDVLRSESRGGEDAVAGVVTAVG